MFFSHQHLFYRFREAVQEVTYEKKVWKTLQVFFSSLEILCIIPCHHTSSAQQDGVTVGGIFSVLSFIQTSAPNGLQTTSEWFANQIRVCVDGTANLCCTIHEQCAYHSPQTKICRVLARTQRELKAVFDYPKNLTLFDTECKKVWVPHY